MSEYYIQVPPDSTGKSVRHSIQIEIDYTNPINPGDITFHKGEVVTFAQSGMVGTVGLDHYVGGIQHTEPHVHLLLTHGSPDTIIANEAMTVGGVFRANATITTRTFYVPVVQVIGSDNPTHGQAIDERGASKVTFAEGEPIFDAFGKMQVSESVNLGQYVFNYDGDDRHYSDSGTLGATVAHDQTVGCMVLTNPITSGATSSRTTDLYHKYTPGIAQFMEMTAAAGDVGKSNVRRRWGYFDEWNGIFFELDGTTLNVVVRSNTTGSVVETRVPQSSWSVDRADGNGGVFNPSGIIIDVSLDNIWWLDFQWLGAGKIRMGIKTGTSTRIVCHTFKNANTIPVSYMRSGSLPMRIEQENIGTAGSISQFRWFCGTVKHEGRFAPEGHRFSYAPPGELTASNTETVFFSIRAALLFKTLKNRGMILPVHMSVSSFDNTTPYAPERVLLSVYSHTTLTSPTWSVIGDEMAEIDIAATGFSGGHLVGSIVASATQTISLTDFFHYGGEHIKNKYDGTREHYTFTVRSLRAGATPNVFGTLTWNEIRD